jgi:hypothetical protein
MVRGVESRFLFQRTGITGYVHLRVSVDAADVIVTEYFDAGEKSVDHSNSKTEHFVGDMPPEKTFEEQGRDQTGQKQIRVTVDERSLQTNYVSSFRPTMTAEEVMLDFGLNLIRPTGNKEHPVELVFQANNRLILSYYSAKRLAIALGQIVRQFEQQFGEIELNAGKRRVDQNTQTLPQEPGPSLAR